MAKKDAMDGLMLGRGVGGADQGCAKYARRTFEVPTSIGRSCVPRFWHTFPRFTHIAEMRARRTPVEVDPTLSTILLDGGGHDSRAHLGGLESAEKPLMMNKRAGHYDELMGRGELRFSS